MGLVRTYVILFVAGWALWLWLDKAGPSPGQSHPMPPYAGAPPGHPGGAFAPGAPGPFLPGAPADLPAREGGIVGELQQGVDLLKAGQLRQAFVFLWRRQSWLLAGVLTVLAALLAPGVGRALRRLPGGWARGRATRGPPGA